MTAWPEIEMPPGFARTDSGTLINLAFVEYIKRNPTNGNLEAFLPNEEKYTLEELPKQSKAVKISKAEVLDAIRDGVSDALRVGDGDLLRVVGEATYDAMWQMITNATSMPCADFYASIEDGVARALERVNGQGGS